MIGKKQREKKIQIKIIEQLLLMLCMIKNKKTYPAYVSKHNLNPEEQAILLMFSNGE